MKNLYTRRGTAIFPDRSAKLHITIASADGETFESFDVRIDEGWKPHKVAAEIRHHVEHAYERTEPAPASQGWRSFARPVGGHVVRDERDDIVCIVPRNRRTDDECKKIAVSIADDHNAALALATR